MIPGQETDDPNTLEDDRQLKTVPAPHTPLPDYDHDQDGDPNPSDPDDDNDGEPDTSDPEPQNPSVTTATGNPPEPSPEQTSPTAAPLNSNSVVIDSQISIALDKAVRGEPLTVAEQAAVEWVAQKQNAGMEIYETDTTVAEVKEGNENYLPFSQNIPLTVNRSSPEYQAVVQELENNSVGGVPPNGQDDRSVVSDTFFAETEQGVTPTLATQDKGIYNKLASIAGIDPAKTGQGVPQAYPNGFNVTVNGKTIRVLPLPNN